MMTILTNQRQNSRLMQNELPLAPSDTASFWHSGPRWIEPKWFEVTHYMGKNCPCQDK